MARRFLFGLALLLLPLAVGVLSIGFGRLSIPVGEIVDIFASALSGAPQQNAQLSAVVLTMRLPRVLLALLVGGGLSAAGAAFQSLFANPLATPDTLGVAAGASFGAALGLLLGFDLIGVQIAALLMGFAAVLLTYSVSWGSERRSLTTVVLAGMVVSSLFSALISLVKFVADSDSQLPAITYWLMGSLDSANFHALLLGAPPILLGLIALFGLRWRLNILPLSDDEARSTGTNLPLLRGLVAFAATLITASAVSMCGQVGWVGLLIPHICRMAFGGNNKVLIPASISLGAVFMVLIDTAARSLSASEIPISILTALIGAPFFIGLLRKTGGWRL